MATLSALVFSLSWSVVPLPGEIALIAGVAAVAFLGAAMAGNVDGPVRLGW